MTDFEGQTDGLDKDVPATVHDIRRAPKSDDPERQIISPEFTQLLFFGDPEAAVPAIQHMVRDQSGREPEET